jgi:fumarate reductase subunit D
VLVPAVLADTKKLSKWSSECSKMGFKPRAGFTASPRLVLPVLVVVMVVFLILASLGGQDVSSARILGTAIVGAIIIALLGVLAIIARGRRRAAVQDGTGTSAAASLGP